MASAGGMAGAPPRPPSPAADRPRRRPVSRACDRCRRRQAKCDYVHAAGSCTHCRDNDVRCTFDLPLARRGPKSKKRAESAVPPGPGLGPGPGPGAVASFSALPPAARPGKRLPSGAANAAHAAGASFASPSTSSAASWEPVGGLGLGHVLSPPAARDFPVPGPPASSGAHPKSALGRWHSLSRALALRSTSVERIATRCLDLFFEYLYPLTPLVHEPSLREGLAFFVGQCSSAPGSRPPPHAELAASPSTVTSVGESWPRFPPDARASALSGGETLKTWPDATFTFLTAVCAEAAFLLPKDLFPEGETVADIFLEASRDCLNHYLEADLESPNANSITIRYFHSNCVHAAGKPKYSWHIFGEATRLAQVMRLHEEASLEGLYPVEAELRRRAFWIVYMGDKSAAILNNRPITIHKFSFESGITTAYPTGLEAQPSSTGSSAGATSRAPEAGRRSFIDGFNANLRLWQAAADLLLEIRMFQDQRSSEFPNTAQTDMLLTEDERQRLDTLYVNFITCLDDLPPYLQSYTFAAIASGGKQTTQSTQFTIQCANLQVSFHCLRMVITQKFEDISYFAPGAEQADLRKTEIVRDMLRVMHEAPFWSLQVNGEPYVRTPLSPPIPKQGTNSARRAKVEKIRLIGASLLAIIHRNQTSPLGARARSDFSVLLDILTRLDSKASDAFRSDSTFAL
ncbi:hypothetical protein TOPH_04647 [Tolypocladium ophioglossoides CBS 100239]|uniref:Zn(2)-C6 fungal-type domain-containing protein n=1 Tax=Tolypocladium ophioglossoides (strain CBS 100239) TaxID=1163406 RepID=A0A0L0N9N7_TOLOC|nr:hypothetical protein TOPH_04647 [Tolypocladium ophioglossoides CBS 100239]